MEININNAFRIAVKVSCGSCLMRYRRLTESFRKPTHDLFEFLLRKPLISTLFCSAFILLVVLALSLALIALIAVSILIFIILLIGGFVLITCAVMIGTSLLTIIVLAISIYGIKLNFLVATKT